jgi:hypothetical protein
VEGLVARLCTFKVTRLLVLQSSNICSCDGCGEYFHNNLFPRLLGRKDYPLGKGSLRDKKQEYSLIRYAMGFDCHVRRSNHTWVCKSLKTRRGDIQGVAPERWKVFKLSTEGYGPFLPDGLDGSNEPEEYGLPETLKINKDTYEYHIRQAPEETTAKGDTPPLTRKLTELCRRYNDGDSSAMDEWEPTWEKATDRGAGGTPR